MKRGDRVQFNNSFFCAWPGVSGGTLEVSKGEEGIVDKMIRSGKARVRVRALEKTKPNDAGIKADHIVEVKPEMLSCLSQSQIAQRAEGTSSAEEPTGS